GRRSGYTTQRSGYTTQRSGVQGRRRREMSDGDVKKKKDEGNEDGRVKSAGGTPACYDDGRLGVGEWRVRIDEDVACSLRNGDGDLREPDRRELNRTQEDDSQEQNWDNHRELDRITYAGLRSRRGEAGVVVLDEGFDNQGGRRRSRW
ncbi:hypothetical protein Droror1_Dr00023411, partial [Drosera rotundifolia]